MQPRVAVVLINWNGLRDTLECLASLRADVYPNKEVIVVDNGSTDESVAVIRRDFPQVTVLETLANLGFTGGNNFGISYSLDNGFDYIFLLNNDTIVEPRAIDELIRAGQSDSEAGLLVPVIHEMSYPDVVWFGGAKLDNSTGVALHDNSQLPKRDDPPRRIPWATGCAMMFKADVLRKVGGFDERYYLYYEDVELSVRTRASGVGIALVPSARILHKGGGSGHVLAGISEYYTIRNNLLLAATHCRRTYVKALRTVIRSSIWRCINFPGRRQRSLSAIAGLRDHLLQRYGRYRRLRLFEVC